ncbi:hypothetical protein [Mesorhizobium sp. YR577]|uniref:hypothetical protein n=1 Tax=Mesorhizobium sp. YR577 TaxID=1884373 RepID=UPI0008E494AE|nr:hypothetical protein [Mesorhizobium sp. YR577]SFU09496.1 hypothetical protein SAMN05518861_112137 [Mesorhizobium sp. YR577]
MTIWKNENSWPRDFGDFIFLTKGVRLVGRAAFPGEWHDSDPLQVPQPDFRGKASEPTQLRHSFIRKLLMDDDTEWKVPFQFQIRPPGVKLPVEQWRVRGEQLLREHKARTDAARARCRQAEQMLLDWLVAGEVRAALRPHEGGSLQPIPNTHWNSENVGSRFATGKLDAENPFKPTSDIRDESAAWIFINVADLARQLPSNPALASVPETELRRSTILRFAIDFSEAHFDFFFEKGRTQKEISRKAQDVWFDRHNSKLPTTVADAIAVVVRELEHGKGKWSRVHSERESRKSN